MQVKKIVIVARGSEEGALEMAIEEALRRIEAGNLSGGDRNESSGFYFEVTDQVPDNELPAGGEPTEANEEGVSVQDITAELQQIGLTLHSTGGGCEAWHVSKDGFYIYVTDEDGSGARNLTASENLVLGYYREGQDHSDPVASVEGPWVKIKPLVEAFQAGQWAEAQSSGGFEGVVDEARQQFWAAIAQAYPMITSGDFPADAELEFEHICKTAVRTWLEANLPAGALIRTEDGYRLERQADGTFTDGDLTFGTLEEMEVDFVVQQGQ